MFETCLNNCFVLYWYMNEYMNIAISIAKDAFSRGEIPVGAVVVHKTQGIVAQTSNAVEQLKDATAHAEILAIKQACSVLGQKRLTDCDLYVTLEPCTMCSGAIAHARLDKIIFGSYDSKGGGIEHGACVFSQPTIHHKPEIIGGVEEIICSQLMKDFFKGKR